MIKIAVLNITLCVSFSAVSGGVQSRAEQSKAVPRANLFASQCRMHAQQRSIALPPHSWWIGWMIVTTSMLLKRAQPHLATPPEVKE